MSLLMLTLAWANIKATVKKSTPLLGRMNQTEFRDKPTALHYWALRMDENAKLFHLDKSSDLQQHKSCVEQHKARLQGAKNSYQTVENRNNQFCSAWTEVLQLSWGLSKIQRCLNINFLAIEGKIQKLIGKKNNTKPTACLMFGSLGCITKI